MNPPSPSAAITSRNHDSPGGPRGPGGPSAPSDPSAPSAPLAPSAPSAPGAPSQTYPVLSTSWSSRIPSSAVPPGSPSSSPERMRCPVPANASQFVPTVESISTSELWVPPGGSAHSISRSSMNNVVCTVSPDSDEPMKRMLGAPASHSASSNSYS